MAPADNKALVNLVEEALQNEFPITLFETSEQLEDYLYDSSNGIVGIDFHVDF